MSRFEGHATTTRHGTEGRRADRDLRKDTPWAPSRGTPLKESPYPSWPRDPRTDKTVGVRVGNEIEGLRGT